MALSSQLFQNWKGGGSPQILDSLQFQAPSRSATRYKYGKHEHACMQGMVQGSTAEQASQPLFMEFYSICKLLSLVAQCIDMGANMPTWSLPASCIDLLPLQPWTSQLDHINWLPERLHHPSSSSGPHVWVGCWWCMVHGAAAAVFIEMHTCLHVWWHGGCSCFNAPAHFMESQDLAWVQL